MKRLLLALLMVGVMPSSADSRHSGRGYESYKHRHASRHRHRTGNTTVVYEPSRARLPAPEVSPNYLEPFSRQEGVRFTTIDISDSLKPMDSFVLFTPDPGSKLAEPPVLIVQMDKGFPRYTFYFFALLLMCILATGTAREIGILKTCHKRNPQQVARLTEWSRKLHSWVSDRWKALVSLT